MIAFLFDLTINGWALYTLVWTDMGWLGWAFVAVVVVIDCMTVSALWRWGWRRWYRT